MNPQHLLVGAVACTLMASSVWGQIAGSGARTSEESIAVHSGHHSNSGPSQTLVFTRVVESPGSIWIRLRFNEVRLDGDSYIAVLSAVTGDRQTLTSQSIGEWGNSTAVFRGDRLTVELFAGPGTVDSYLNGIDILAGQPLSYEPQEEPEILPRKDPQRQTICAVNDMRTAYTGATSHAIGRLGSYYGAQISGFCTASVVHCPGGCGEQLILISAGHCFIDDKLAGSCTAPGPPNTVQWPRLVEFEVPLSSRCTQVPASPIHQFPVVYASIKARACGPGDDWAVFQVGRNSSNQTLSQVQREFLLPQFAGASARLATLAGYGTDGSPIATNASGNPKVDADNHCKECQPATGAESDKNATLQGHHTYITKVDGTRVEHSLHACAGNSGSPLFVNGTSGREQLAIHTHGNSDAAGFALPCSTATPVNKATNLAHRGLCEAIKERCKLDYNLTIPIQCGLLPEPTPPRP